LSIFLVLLPKVVVYLFFCGFGKKKSARPRLWAPADQLPLWFFWLIISSLRQQPPSTTPCPSFLSGHNWILNWRHYRLLPLLPRKNFSEIFVFYYNLVILVEKHWLFLKNWWNVRKKNIMWEGPNLSSIPELLGFG
jgi:hypothetical protein